VRTNRIVRPSRAAISVTTRGDDQQVVLHRLDLGRGRRDRAGHRVVQVAPDQRGDLAVQRRREQQPLPLGRREVEDGADLGQEAHVGHPVGLVDRGDLDRGQVARALVRVVGEPARRGDQQVDPTLQLGGLPVERHAAHHRGHGQAERLGVGHDGVDDLLRELAGRDEDEAARAPGLRAPTVQAGQQREAEGQGLARARLATAQQVAPGEGLGEGGRLDGERRGEAARRQRPQHGLGQAEVGEGGHPRLGDGPQDLRRHRRGEDRGGSAGAAGTAGRAGSATTRGAAGRRGVRRARGTASEGRRQTNLRDVARRARRWPAPRWRRR
jgi:hypothetical protein